MKSKGNFTTGMITGALVGSALGLVAKNMSSKNLDKAKSEAKKAIHSAEKSAHALWGNIKG